MNKSNGSLLELVLKLKWKKHQPTFNDLVCDENHFKTMKYQPHAVCVIKLNYFHIYVHSHYQKNI
jgi:hypothetical protein